MGTARTMRVALGCAALAALGSCSRSVVDADPVAAVGPECAPRRGEGTIKRKPLDLFSGLDAKPSPDTVANYRPALAAKLAELPDVNADNLTDALTLLREAVRVADGNPGQWQEGNVALGAEQKEYAPSDEELLAAELGERLRETFRMTDPGPVAWALTAAGVGPGGVPYRSFDIRHVDVAGSGRFFYASAPVEQVLTVRLPR